MIITRSPLRISLGGGGTDLPSYYERHGGFVLSAAIDKHVYVTVHEPFVDQIILKYAQMESVGSVGEITHPVIREVLQLMGTTRRIEVASMSDIPAGTGLGSSGSFTTALLKGLHILTRRPVQPTQLAEEACDIEINRLKEPVGKQDQYIAAFGGITAFTIDRSGQVMVEPLQLSGDIVAALEENLMLLFTGFTRSAATILSHQDAQTRRADPVMLDNLNAIRQIGYDIRGALEAGDLRAFGELLHTHWLQKRARSAGMTNREIDCWYERARQNGAIGGKVVGAGGGGFLMLYTEDKTRLRRAFATSGLREIRLRFDFEGSKLVAQS